MFGSELASGGQKKLVSFSVCSESEREKEPREPSARHTIQNSLSLCIPVTPNFSVAVRLCCALGEKRQAEK